MVQHMARTTVRIGMRHLSPGYAVGATSAGMKLEVQPATPFAWLESQVPAVATGIVTGNRRLLGRGRAGR
jgi:hypothetical protein